MESNLIHSIIEALENQKLFLPLVAPFAIERGADSEPLFFCSANAVTFKIYKNDTPYSLKCYFEHRSDRSEHYRAVRAFVDKYDGGHFVEFEFFDNALNLFVDSGEMISTDFILSRWVEGVTLHDAILHSAHFGDVERLRHLRHEFLELVRYSICSGFVHGDLKPQNIILQESDDRLMFIDYDAAWLKDIAHLKNRELGTVWYQHPARDLVDWSERIDNYPIVLITISFLALEQRVGLFERYNNHDNILFSPINIVNGLDEAFAECWDMWSHSARMRTMLNSLKIKFPYSNSIMEFIDEVMAIGVRRTISDRDILIDNSGALRRFCSEEGLYGYCSDSGEIVIEPDWSDASVFCEDVAEVRSFGETMWVDTKGNKLSMPFRAK